MASEQARSGCFERARSLKVTGVLLTARPQSRVPAKGYGIKQSSGSEDCVQSLASGSPHARARASAFYTHPLPLARARSSNRSRLLLPHLYTFTQFSKSPSLSLCVNLLNRRSLLFFIISKIKINVKVADNSASPESGGGAVRFALGFGSVGGRPVHALCALPADTLAADGFDAGPLGPALGGGFLCGGPAARRLRAWAGARATR